MSPCKLFVGIDVSKRSHVAGFLTSELLQVKRFLLCPTHKIEQSRSGLDFFLKLVQTFGASPQTTAVVMEQTGHYHLPLLEALQAEGFACYVVAIHRKKTPGVSKTDRYDALRLANMLYAQIGRGVQADDSTQIIEQRLPPTDVAAQLAPLVQMHYEHTQQQTRCCNKLTSLIDEIFPEWTEVFKYPNAIIALEYRAKFPTPASIAAASLEELQALRHSYPTFAQLEQLQALAQRSIGVKAPARLRGLLLEQKQLIDHVVLIREQLDTVDTEIHRLIDESREGQILRSLPGIGHYTAATLLAAIGNIRNFSSASRLRRYAGWAPQSFQTGTTTNRDKQSRGGNRIIKQEIYLLAVRAIKADPWKSLYQRLVLKKCSYDARLKKYNGKNKVIGRVAGTIITMVYKFLKEDADLVEATPKGQELPPPNLYNLEIHLSHRAGVRIHQSA